MKKIALLLLAGATLLSTNVTAEENRPASKVTKIFDRELPNVPGKSMRAVLGIRSWRGVTFASPSFLGLGTGLLAIPVLAGSGA